jgi:hypothetical protein
VNKQAIGFEINKIPLGKKGAERLAFRFQEVTSLGELVGKVMVAKESKSFKKAHCSQACQGVQQGFAEDPCTLKPVNDYNKLPLIRFIQYHVYEYTMNDDLR